MWKSPILGEGGIIGKEEPYRIIPSSGFPQMEKNIPPGFNTDTFNNRTNRKIADTTRYAVEVIFGATRHRVPCL
jgi:hypothetical protein